MPSVVCRCGLDPELLWLWLWSAAATPIRLLAWELPGAAPKTKKKYIQYYHCCGVCSVSGPGISIYHRCTPNPQREEKKKKRVLVEAQQITNLIGILEDAGSIPGFAQCFRIPGLTQQPLLLQMKL